MKKTFNRGDQVAYIPTHAKGDIKHKDVEFGFVTSGPAKSIEFPKETYYFIRYWTKESTVEDPELRTKANSAMANLRNLKPWKFTSEENVQRALEEYCSWTTGKSTI